MSVDELVYGVKAWIEETGWPLLLGAAVIIVAVGVSLWAVWPTLRPRPTPQYQTLDSLATTTTAKVDANAPVPQEVAEQIMEDVGVDDPNLISVSWADSAHEKITVAVAVGPTDFKNYEYVRVDGEWKRE